MGEIINCPRCGKIFAKALRPVCNDCFKEYEKMFQKVYAFMRKRENREATIPEIVEHTGVEEKYIHQFVKDGRLKPTHFPNLSYPCDSCGAFIREGRICSECRHHIYEGLKRERKEKEFLKRKKRREQQEKRERFQTYHSMDVRLEDRKER